MWSGFFTIFFFLKIQEFISSCVQIHLVHHDISHSNFKIRFLPLKTLRFSTSNIFHTLKSHSNLIEHDLRPTCVVLHFLRIGNVGNIQYNVHFEFILLQILWAPQHWYIDQQMVGNYEYEACVTLNMELNRTNIGFSFIFIVQWLRIQSKMKFNFFHQFVKFCLSDQPIFYDYFCVFVNWDVVCMFEGKGTFSSTISSEVRFEYYFWSLIKFKILG